MQIQNPVSQSQALESSFPAMSKSPKSTRPYQYVDLLAAQPKLQTCIKTSQALFESHFAQESKTRVETMTWLELHSDLRSLEVALNQALIQAQNLHSNLTPSHDLGQTQKALADYPEHSKRQDLLALFQQCGVNEELGQVIDQAFAEDPDLILAIVNPNSQRDILALLEEQLKGFSEMLGDLGLAVSAEEQETYLYKLLGDPGKPDELFFDVFASGFSALTEFDLLLATIAMYKVICA